MDLRTLEARVVAAPMAGGPSTPQLVTAAGEAGGLGFIAAGNITADAVATQIVRVRSGTRRPFGINLFVPTSANTYPAAPGTLTGDDRVRAIAEYRAELEPDAGALRVRLPQPRPGDTDDWDNKIDLVTRERVPLVSFTFGLPSNEVFTRLRDAGITTVVTVTDTDEVRAALAAGADALCVQGPDGGGHRGTLDVAKKPESVDVADLVRAARAITDAPIIAAGGIGDAGRSGQVLAAGADAVQLGTAFLLSPEAGTSPPYRRALADPAYRTTIVTRAFTGRFARALETDFIRAHHAAAPAAHPEIGHLTGPLRRASRDADRPDYIALWAGTAWRSARAQPAASIVREFGAQLVG